MVIPPDVALTLDGECVSVGACLFSCVFVSVGVDGGVFVIGLRRGVGVGKLGHVVLLARTGLALSGCNMTEAQDFLLLLSSTEFVFVCDGSMGGN